MSDLGDNFDDRGPEDYEVDETEWEAYEPSDDELSEAQYATLETIWGPEADRIESAAYNFERAQTLADVRDALVRVEALTTVAGWLDFAVSTENSVRGLGEALAQLAPPRVEWAVGLGSAGGTLDDDTDWEVNLSGLELTVALPEPGSDPIMWRRLDEHRATLVQRTQEWVGRRSGEFDDYVVKWQLLAQAGDRHIHLESSEQVHAALLVALTEASTRVWIAVPWWRDDNRYGAAVADQVIRCARDGLDVRVLMRPPNQGNFDSRRAEALVQRLHKASAKIALNPTEHSKTFIIDDLSILSSSNLTESDTFLDNNGDLSLGFQGTNARASAFLRRWETLFQARRLLA